MAGLLTRLAAGVATGAGKGLVENGKSLREAQREAMREKGLKERQKKEIGARATEGRLTRGARKLEGQRTRGAAADAAAADVEARANEARLKRESEDERARLERERLKDEAKAARKAKLVQDKEGFYYRSDEEGVLIPALDEEGFHKQGPLPKTAATSKMTPKEKATLVRGIIKDATTGGGETGDPTTVNWKMVEQIARASGLEINDWRPKKPAKYADAIWSPKEGAWVAQVDGQWGIVTGD